MPTAKYFSKYPEFPADVSVSDIPTVSFEKLERGADDEPNRLYNACREFGFFKLDLQSSENGRVLLQHAEMMLDVCAETLTLDRAILNNYAYNPPKDLLGYAFSFCSCNTRTLCSVACFERIFEARLTSLRTVDTRPLASSKLTMANLMQPRCIRWGKTTCLAPLLSAQTRHHSRIIAQTAAPSFLLLVALSKRSCPPSTRHWVSQKTPSPRFAA